MRFSASKVHLVASAPAPTQVTVTIDDFLGPTVEISRPTLHTLFDGDVPGEHRLSLEADAPGLSLFSAMFG